MRATWTATCSGSDDIGPATQSKSCGAFSARIGMALEETTVYLARDAGGPLGHAVAVESVRLFGHVIMGGITGFGIGLIHCRRSSRAWPIVAAGCLAAGVAIHFLWDWIALTNLMRTGWETSATVASVVLMVVAIAIYGALVVAGSRASREVFAGPERRP